MTKEEILQQEKENEEKKKIEEQQKLDDELEQSNMKMGKITLEESIKESYADMDIDDKRKLMTAKSNDSVVVKKKKRGSRGKAGNKRTLLF
mmetsp:Transcript_8694/g.9879  ORF Transcript_8694/g.9879 Transcript_8694/m.9879 type:complete len:91 (+) Transcript_8694:357-629(+)